jgi:nucleotide-binding universal stress UspA family protein
MATQSLIRSINDYLDAGKLLEWRRELGTGLVEQLKRFDRARRHLQRELADAKPEDASLIEAAETLLDAETTPPREVDDRLQDQLLKRVRQDVIERVRQATHGREAHVDEPDVSRSIPLTARILIAIDETEPSEWAADVAAGLARSLGAHVMVLHVVEPVPPEMAYGTEDLRQKRHDRAAAFVQKAQWALPPSIESDHMIRTGAAAEEILFAARLWEADLIVMGTRGRSRVAQFVLGSTAEAVIRQAPCPVMTVGHAPERFVGQPKRSSSESLLAPG